MTTEFDWANVRETLRLEEVLEELGLLVDPTKDEYIQSCPLPTHPGSDSSPSFSINGEKLLWNCFTCARGGPLPLLVALLQETDWDEALDWLAGFSDADTEDIGQFVEQLKRYFERNAIKPKYDRSVHLPFFNWSVLDRFEPAPLEIVAKWNIKDPATIETFRLRYDENHRRKDYIGPALIIPSTYRGQLVGYQQRWLGDRPKGLPKITSTSDFPRQETLFNWDRPRDEATIVVESPMTVIYLHELGLDAVATFGGQLNDRQLELLASIRHLILAFDNDETGLKATDKAADFLSNYTDTWVLKPSGAVTSDLADFDPETVFKLIDTTVSSLEYLYD